MSLEYIVTGTGRCGTGYMAKLLTGAGVPCGHEKILRPDHKGNVSPGEVLRLMEKHSHLRADSSWLAVPYLDNPEIVPKSSVLIHCVRNPLDVISSLLEIKHFENTENRFTRFSFSQMPELEKYDSPIDQAAAWYLHWNTRIHHSSDWLRYIRHRVEDPAYKILKQLNLPQAEADRNYNSRKSDGYKRLDYCDIPDQALARRLMAMAVYYGYREGTLFKKEKELLDHYNAHPEYNSSVCGENWDKVIEPIKEVPSRILDIGCGDGRVCWLARNQWLDAEITGVDYCQVRIDIAQRTVPRVKFIQQDINMFLLGRREVYDLIFAFEFLEHLQDPKAVLDSAMKLLRTGGLLVGSVPLRSPYRAHLSVFEDEGDVEGRLGVKVFLRDKNKAFFVARR